MRGNSNAGRELRSRRPARTPPPDPTASGRLRTLLACLLIVWLVAAGQAPAAQGPEGLEPLRQEASRGLPSAQYTLGRLYLLGTSLEQDVSRGLELVKGAAAQDYPPALLFLGRIHERGIGVSRDFVEARHWYERASELGIEAAELKLAPFRDDEAERGFTLFKLPLLRATPFAVRFVLQKEGARPLSLMDGSFCDTFASNGLLAGSDRIRACYTEQKRLAHLEYRFPPEAAGDGPVLAKTLDRLVDKYGQAKVTESGGVPVEYSWRLGRVSIAFWMDHPSGTAFLRYTVRARQESYLREQERRREARQPPDPKL